MKINLFFEENFIENEKNFEKFLNKHSTYLEFEVAKKRLQINGEYISFPKIHNDLYDQLSLDEREDYFNFFFTDKQYDNNYFFEGYNNFVPFSMFAWEHLTPLPIENGILYFIIDYLILQVDKSKFRHKEKTGCIFDFLWDKTGVDDGMRQAQVCSGCLERVESFKLHKNDQKIFDDLKSLMNVLSNSSKWNKNILEEINNSVNGKFSKRKPINDGEINVMIASPSDLIEERKILLNNLERKFRVDRHEDNCKQRLIVHGWEDIASQVGYSQNVINQNIIENVDIVLAVFKYKIGTPTKDEDGNKRANSGTIEEFLFTLDESKSSPLGMIYFYSKAPEISLDSPDFSKIKSDWDKVKKFKDTIKEKVIYKPYSSKNELLDLVTIDLVKNIKDYFE